MPSSQQFNVGIAGKLYIAPPRGTMNNPIIDGSGITATRTYTLLDMSGTLSLQTTTLTSGRVVIVGTGGSLADSANLRFDGTYLIANSIKNSALANGYFVDSGAGGLLQNTYFPVTTVDSPGADSHIPTEKAVRTALDLKITNPMTTDGDMLYSNDNLGTPARLPMPVYDGQYVLNSFMALGGHIDPYWDNIQSALAYAVCNKGDIITLNDEIIYI